MRRSLGLIIAASLGAAGMAAALVVGSSADTSSDCTKARSEALLANRIVAPSQSYRKDNPAEYAKVRLYFEGGARPTGVTSHMGLHLIYGEDACRGGVTTTTDTTTTTTATQPPGPCFVSTPNVPDGPDNSGGCFPGPSNTGPNAATMPAYTGSCTISTANVTIDSKTVTCRTLVVAASGFVLKNSYLNGGIVQSGGNPSFTVQDSFIDSGVQYPAASTGAPAGKYACGDPNNQTTDCGVTGTNYTILRTEIINSNRAAYCEAPGPCLIQDNYFHGTNLWPDVSNRAHASSVRNEQNLTLRHNSLHCSYAGPFPNSDIGCSADMSGYPDFVPINHALIERNLFMANTTGIAFCIYGGGTSGKPHSGDATNATYIVIRDNVFQRGGSGKCGAYGPVTDFISGRVGNVWSGNVWDNGGVVPPG